MPNEAVALQLARTLMTGTPEVEAIVRRAATLLGQEGRWLRPLARRYLSAFSRQTRPRQEIVTQFLLADPGFRRNSKRARIADWLQREPEQMLAVAAASGWNLPAIESIGGLAEWLELAPSELDWFADLKHLGRHRGVAALRHYHYRIVGKSSGGTRLIEAPKPRLKALQKKILTAILDSIPPHPAVHGFRRGRSIKTFLAPHVGKQVVLKMDLENYFPSFGVARIQAFLRTAGYPETVADVLGGICTTVTPRDVIREDLYWRPHLPQGAPTSPALANLCTFRADCRLAGLARAAGAEYTRYADDIAFSGDVDFARGVERFSTHVAAILMEEGLSVHHRKTRIMRQGVRQQLVGLVANEHVNIRRDDFDELKATLTNCMRRGAASQNREGHAAFRQHLEGRVAFVESINPGKGARLRRIWEQIRW